MRVLMLSWEYPPVVVGGLGRHVHALAKSLAAQGHDVVVLCRQPAGTDAVTHPGEDVVGEGVRVVRVAEDPAHLTFEDDLVAWTLAMGHAMTRTGLALLREWRPQVVHAHDWLVAHAAITLAEAADAPLVSTIHATEAGRHSGWLSHTLNQQIHSVEWWLANRSDGMITCSAAMRDEALHLFEVEPELITVLHNGIEPRRWRVDQAEVARARATHAPDGAPLLLFFGRLEWEKGVQDLLAALPRIRRSHPGARLVVAGKGIHEPHLVAAARKLRVRRAVDFVGHLSDQALSALLPAADTVILPSRYEPFGIVALEAAAAGAPLVASTAGGLGEVVRDGRTGLSFTPGDLDGLTSAVRAVLDDPAAAKRRAKAAKARLSTDFNWDLIAADTAAVYAATSRRPHPVLGRPKIPSGNVFGRE
ncbi:MULTISPECIES: glycosyltransferase family 4 protein [unclassified Crossiella]|uniref:glycosyltransferase family 4 protein n=1 Tax=unclassified Crossiella TaxID=2620835 RepID=UPI001FFF6BF7|nr:MULTISPECIES: glycosyltransferase family 4 protein [unclassified Crossiella]MCK2242236.1 glycosyltransferase family 4 protein [Crossiella sp. S99.2]MCK2254733.1 glycosyltransferase family 4 protein [Crossiella sp. S99.1]